MYIIHIGVSGFPSNSAPIQRILLTLKGLKILGLNPLVINKHSINIVKYNKINRQDGIPFVFTSLTYNRPKSFIFRNINRLSGVFGEGILLIKKRKKLHTAILYTPSFGELVYYRILSKLLGFKMIIQYVELRSSISDRSSFFNKLNDNLFDNKFYFFCDGVIAISDFLIKHVREKDKDMPIIKIPAMCDFAEFDKISPYKGTPYLMYCGSIAYNEVIEFIIDLYYQLKTVNLYKGDLVLVISGQHEVNWQKIGIKINQYGLFENIIIKSNIPYPDLLSFYMGATVLIIPLRDTTQDIARFPHKIGEYTAARRPILSSDLGELAIYFKDGVSAILAKEYSIASYQEKLNEVLQLGNNLDKIGETGHDIGIRNFDFHAQTIHLKEFILAL